MIKEMLLNAFQGCSKQLIRDAVEVEKSQRRFEAVGASTEEVKFLIRACNQHRSNFQLDKELAQVMAKGEADGLDIKALQSNGPTLFTDFNQTYLEALSKKLAWRKLLESMNTEPLQ